MCGLPALRRTGVSAPRAQATPTRHRHRGSAILTGKLLRWMHGVGGLGKHVSRRIERNLERRGIKVVPGSDCWDQDTVVLLHRRQDHRTGPGRDELAEHVRLVNAMPPGHRTRPDKARSEMLRMAVGFVLREAREYLDLVRGFLGDGA
jgi:hypothetical protein